MKYQSSQSRGLLPAIIIEYVYLKATQKSAFKRFQKNDWHIENKKS